MLDLYAHFAALEVLRVRLKREFVSGSLTAASAVETLKAIESTYPFAVLGSVVDHLIAHAGPSDAEVDRLQKAHALAVDVRAFLNDLRDVRTAIENVARNPKAANALADYNAARAALADLYLRYDPLVARLQAFVWQLHPLRHLTQHPVSTDQPTGAWPWRDLFLSRRTGAFAAEVMKLARASGRPEAIAFAFGVGASYVGNIFGSSYLTHGVGGPRRSHVYRDRLASYSVGAWFRHGQLAEGADFDPIRRVPLFGSPQNPALPPWLTALLKKAFSNVYASGDLPAVLPDVEAAYVQLLEHWRLLHSFPPLAPAEPIDDTLDLAIVNTLTPQDKDPDEPTTPRDGPEPEPDGPERLFDPGPGSPPWFMEKHEDWLDYVKEACLDLLFLPIFLIRVGFWLGHDANENEPPKSGGLASRASKLSTPLTQSEFDAVMGGKDILIAVVWLHHLDAGLHHFATACLKVLKVVGLIYPEREDLLEPTYRQFVVLPPASLGVQWPSLPPADPALFLQPPAGSLEAPATSPSTLGPGHKPIAFLMTGFGGSASVMSEGFDLLLDELRDLPSSPLRSSNLNLDADRGHLAACWTPAAGTSVTDNPQSPVVLSYGDV
ncbi:hypothetical protein EHS39_34545 [Ensifer sp. MPMI2T]|nr:hypothetical protein EHS39_34545 [Ensifer sp. MPMI2T]